jgi:hypothetical protein
MRSKAPAPERPSYQAIQPDELLPLPVVKQRLRWGDETISKAQKEGLQTWSYAKWKYTTGAALIAFLTQRAGSGQEGAAE